MSERLSDGDLDLIGLRFPTHFGMPETSVLVQRLLSEIRERRAADLSSDERTALDFARDVIDTHGTYTDRCEDAQLASLALAVLDRLLATGGER